MQRYSVIGLPMNWNEIWSVHLLVSSNLKVDGCFSNPDVVKHSGNTFYEAHVYIALLTYLNAL